MPLGRESSGRDDRQGGKIRSVASRITGQQRHAANDRVRAHVEVRNWRAFGSASLPVREEGLSGKEPGLVGQRLACKVGKRRVARIEA